MKKIFTIAAACVALVACNEKFIETPINNGFGYLDINLSTNDDIVVSTKAAEVPSDVNSYNLYLYKSADLATNLWATETGTVTYGTLEVSQKKLAAGNYKLATENITATAAETGNGALRLASETDITINAGNTTTATLACTVVNSLITSVCKDFNTYFKSYTVTFSRSERTLTPSTSAADHDNADKMYFNVLDAANEVSWKITALRNDDINKVFTGTIAPVAAKWHQVTFTASATDGEISTITITADETITPVDVPEPINPLD